MDGLSQVTAPPGHHFFGYYEKSPWNTDESLLLAHETDFQDRRPTPEDVARICLIDTDTGRCDRVAETTAWDFQQGAMLQWLGAPLDHQFIYNDRSDDGFVSHIRDETGEHVRTIPHPVYAVNPDGETGYFLDYGRLDRTRPGYGYPSGEEASLEPHPDDDGIYRVDLSTGTARLLVSLQELAGFEREPSMSYGLHWVNHIQPSPDGKRVAFIHRSETPDDRRWLDRLFLLGADGTDLELLHSGFVSHYDWRTARDVLAWTDRGGEAFYLYDVNGSVRSVGRDVLPRDGHCSFSPSGEWLLLDTYPTEDRQRGLFIYHWERGELLELGWVHSPRVDHPSLRCDLHPRWDRSGRRVCFDSTHDGTRQMYTLDLGTHLE